MNWWQILIVVIALIIFCYLAAGIIVVFLANYKLFSVRGKDINNDCYLKYEDFHTLNRSEYEVFYKDATIKGFIYTSNNDNEKYKGFIILSHGMWSSHVTYLSDIEYLTGLGYKVLGYDNYGVCLSGGNNQVSLAHSIYVLDVVISDVERRNLNEDLDILLYGHSMGGYATSCNLKNHQEIKKAIIRSAPISPSISGRDLLIKNNKYLGYFLYPIINLCFYLLYGRKENQSSISSLKKNKKTNILLIHAENDNIVPFKNSLARYFLNHKQDNIEVFISKVGKHNSIMEESSMDNYVKLKNEYYRLVKENDSSKIDSFLQELKQKKREYYHLNKNTLNSIYNFLIN